MARRSIDLEPPVIGRLVLLEGAHQVLEGVATSGSLVCHGLSSLMWWRVRSRPAALRKRPASRAPSGRARRAIPADAGLGQHREGDQRDLPEVDLGQVADAGLRVGQAPSRSRKPIDRPSRAPAASRALASRARATSPARPAADREAASSSASDSHTPIGSAASCCQSMRTPAAPRRARLAREGAAADAVARQVDAVEEAGIAGEAAIRRRRGRAPRR